MSSIVYNNVQLPYGHTTRFEQSSVYDPSGTDRILTKFDISVTCLISSIYASQLNPALGALTASPADFMAWLRATLLVPRQKLSVQVNGVELIPQPQPNKTGTVDAHNGPQPKECQILALNDTLFLLNYHIVAHYWESYTAAPTPPVVSTNAAGSTVLYNRWKETIVIDERNFTKRVRAGRFQIRSDNIGGTIPDLLRAQMAIVGIPSGFLRTRNEYTVTEDGLGLEYIQEDQEVFKQPPQPAFKAEGTFRIHTLKNNTGYVTASVTLTGDGSLLGGAGNGRAANQLAIANKAVAVAHAKLFTINTINFIKEAALEFDLYDNRVSYTVTVFINADPSIVKVPGSAPVQGGTTGGLAFMASVLASPQATSTLTPYSDAVTITRKDGSVLKEIPADPPPAYILRGTAGLLLQAASYFDPSIVGATVKPQDGAAFIPDSIPRQTGSRPSQWQTTSILPSPGQTG